jgi:hypothetical protein
MTPTKKPRERFLEALRPLSLAGGIYRRAHAAGVASCFRLACDLMASGEMADQEDIDCMREEAWTCAWALRRMGKTTLEIESFLREHPFPRSVANIPNIGVLVADWHTSVRDRADVIDPQEERQWRDLSYGWALGRGLTPKQAEDFSLFVYYTIEMSPAITD